MLFNKTNSIIVCFLLILKDFNLNIIECACIANHKKQHATAESRHVSPSGVSISLSRSNLSLNELITDDWSDEEDANLKMHFGDLDTDSSDSEKVVPAVNTGHEFGNGYGIYVDPETREMIDNSN